LVTVIVLGRFGSLYRQNLVDFPEYFFAQTLAKMRHERPVEGRVILICWKSNEVLQVWANRYRPLTAE
jgi:hypothetical protein